MEGFGDLMQLSVPTLIALGARLGVETVIKERIVEVVRAALLNDEGAMELAVVGSDARKDHQGNGSHNGGQTVGGNCRDKSDGKGGKGKGQARDKPREARRQIKLKVRSSSLTGETLSGDAAEEPPLPASASGAGAPASGAAPRRSAVTKGAGKQRRAAGRKVIQGQGKQSGMTGVYWNTKQSSWTVAWGPRGARKGKSFAVCRYMRPGKTPAEADADALRNAIAFRTELVQQGKIQASHGRLRGKFVRKVKGNEMRQRGGNGAGLGEAMERDSGVAGVTWLRPRCVWHAAITINGKQIHRDFRPEDSTPEAIERARVAAVECRWALECQKAEQLAAGLAAEG
eukprot:CAMPEP_0179024358 /NCGR_PEP_ID=MMETSP0796-20121207/7412_1 /TAXON_ID=73915 /ORGANISM="Pyrodinium bahamense, Strain pbaha01" /LENGTH=342 /DNA_ID=CAMNT_0020720313 /DNA_START=17 /DNA_END=1045 /DNA_ORIENTATION=+